MGKFYDRNKDSDLTVLKEELTKAQAEALKDPSNVKDFVQMLGLIMTKKTGEKVTDQQIDYVTSRLLDSTEKTNLGTGEGKSSASMLLLASQELLDKKIDLEDTIVQVLQRDLQDFRIFFNTLGFNVGCVQNQNIAHPVLTPLRTPNPAQIHGRIARRPNFESDSENAMKSRQTEGFFDRTSDVKQNSQDLKDPDASSQSTPPRPK